MFYGPLEAMARPQGKAIQAYWQVIQPDLDRGPLCHVAQVMSGPVIALEEDSALASAWRTLRDSHIRQAPAIDDYDKLVGIVSEPDLMTAIDIDGSR